MVVHISDSTLYNSHPKNSASILIQDSLPVVELALNGDPEAPEGGGATRMTLSRTDAGAEIEVNLSISGTANNQSDYVSIANRVRMPRGTRTVNIEVQAIDDPVREVAEDVVLKVLPGEGYTIGAQLQARARRVTNSGPGLRRGSGERPDFDTGGLLDAAGDGEGAYGSDE